MGGEEEGGGGAAAADGALESSTAVGASYSEAEGYGKMDPLSAATALFRRPGCVAEWVVIKCGPDGASVAARGTRCTSGARGSRSGTPSGAGTSAAAVVLGYAEIKGEEEALDAPSGKIAYLPNEACGDDGGDADARDRGGCGDSDEGAGRNVADLETVEALRISARRTRRRRGIWERDASERAKKMLDESLRRGGKR